MIVRCSYGLKLQYYNTLPLTIVAVRLSAAVYVALEPVLDEIQKDLLKSDCLASVRVSAILQMNLNNTRMTLCLS